MKSRIAQTIIAGFVTTVVMTFIGLVAPYMGLPRMNAAEMLSAMMGVSLAVGYFMHLIIGTIFAAAYVFLFNSKLHTGNRFLKGLLFGLAVFVFAQIMMLLIGMMKPMPVMENKALLMIGSLIGYLVFGVTIALLISGRSVSTSKNKLKTAQAY